MYRGSRAGPKLSMQWEEGENHSIGSPQHFSHESSVVVPVFHSTPGRPNFSPSQVMVLDGTTTDFGLTSHPPGTFYFFNQGVSVIGQHIALNIV